MRQRLGELQEEMRGEGRAAEQPYKELSALHPDWVDYWLSREPRFARERAGRP